LFIFGLIAAMSLNNAIEVAQPIGFSAIAAALSIGNVGLLVYLSFRARLPAMLGPVLVAALLLVAVYLIGVVQRPNFRALTVAAQVALTMGFLFAVSVCSWKRRSLVTFAWLSGLYIALHAIWWVVSGRPDGFSGYLTNPNALGPFIYLMLFFVVSAQQTSVKRGRLWKGTFLLLGLIALVSVNNRSIWLAALASSVTYFSWSYITRSWRRFQAWLAADVIRAAWGLAWYPLVIGVVLGVIPRSCDHVVDTDEQTRRFLGTADYPPFNRKWL